MECEEATECRRRRADCCTELGKPQKGAIEHTSRCHSDHHCSRTAGSLRSCLRSCAALSQSSLTDAQKLLQQQGLDTNAVAGASRTATAQASGIFDQVGHPFRLCSMQASGSTHLDVRRAGCMQQVHAAGACQHCPHRSGLPACYHLFRQGMLPSSLPMTSEALCGPER